MQQMMGDMDIAFPNLGIYLHNVPKTIMVGSFGIAIYGILIALSMLMGISIAAYIAKKTGQDPDLYWDSFVWIMISAIVGARIYYVIFMWDFYKDNLLEIFNLRGGGLAIYGGIILSVITIFVFCKKKKANPRLFLDTIAFGLVLGQVLGRWGNFFNREVFGEYTDGLFAMRLPVSMVRASDISESIASHMQEGTNYIQVHPTFLYEGMWNLMVFVVLVIYLKKHFKKFDGEIFLVYLAGYGTGRAIIEYIRTDQLYIPGTKIPVSMVLGIVMALVSLTVIIIGRHLAGKKNLYQRIKSGSTCIKQKDNKNRNASGQEKSERRLFLPVFFLAISRLFMCSGAFSCAVRSCLFMCSGASFFCRPGTACESLQSCFLAPLQPVSGTV